VTKQESEFVAKRMIATESLKLSLMSYARGELDDKQFIGEIQRQQVIAEEILFQERPITTQKVYL